MIILSGKVSPDEIAVVGQEGQFMQSGIVVAMFLYDNVTIKQVRETVDEDRNNG